MPTRASAVLTRLRLPLRPAGFAFERAAVEVPLFPELFTPGRLAVLLAVDPDLGGAVAALCWDNPPAGNAAPAADDGGSSSSGSSSSGNNIHQPPPPQQQQEQQDSAQPAAVLPLPGSVRVELFDMPVEVWKYGSRDKRQPAAAGLITILRRYVPGLLTGGGGAGGEAFAVPISSKPKPKKVKAPQGEAQQKEWRRGGCRGGSSCSGGRGGGGSGGGSGGGRGGFRATAALLGLRPAAGGSHR